MELNNKILKIAILSDIHCHSIEQERKESYFLAGGPRNPGYANPIQALMELISQEEISCDYLVCAGDMSNKASSVGLAFSWYAIKEIAQKINAKTVLPTIGNHDVDSRNISGKHDPFHMARTISSDFPFGDQASRDSYWNNGFSIIDTYEDVRFLVINSAIDHNDEVSAKRGTFSEERIERLRIELSKIDSNKNGVVLMHHHPYLHSSIDMTADDVLPTGDQLLNICTQFGYKFFIHGHRHFPKLARLTLNGGEQHILGAGSFSQILSEMGSYTRNLFHILNIDTQYSFSRGWVNSWEYNIKSGWNRATSSSASFPYHAGFGVDVSMIDKIVNDVIEFAEKQGLGYIEADEIYSGIPDIKYLQPEAFVKVKQKLGERKWKMAFDDDKFIGLGRIK